MQVLRGGHPDPATDRRHTEALVAAASDRSEPAVRVWYPPPHVAFGRRDRQAPGYETARERAATRGYPPLERAVGGRAVAFTGGTLAFVHAEPTGPDRGGISARYEATTDTLLSAFRDLGVALERGEPPNAFCPGTHSLQADGKVAGLAQRLRRQVAIVAGVVVVSDAAAVAAVLEPVYDALGVPFDPESVGALASGACDAPSREAVRATLETALVGGRDHAVERVGADAPDRG